MRLGSACRSSPAVEVVFFNILLKVPLTMPSMDPQHPLRTYNPHVSLRTERASAHSGITAQSAKVKAAKKQSTSEKKLPASQEASKGYPAPGDATGKLFG